MKNVNLKSRYKDVHTTLCLFDDSNGVITSDGNYTRVILDESGKAIKGIDFEGGPMLCVGEVIEGTDKKIKSIKSSYYVELV